MEGCRSLVVLIISDGVTHIDDNAFNYCDSLTSVTIASSVTSIGNNAFGGCGSLASVVIPEGVTSIGNRAFGHCPSLTSVVIPEGVTSIGSSTFGGCSSLTSVVIPEGVTDIGDFAFSSCTGLASITIPASVTKIENEAFGGCIGLTSATISAVDMQEIGVGAFRNCTSLDTIYCKSATPPLAFSYTFRNVKPTCVVMVPSGNKAAYEKAGGWRLLTIVEDKYSGIEDEYVGRSIISRHYFSESGMELPAVRDGVTIVVTLYDDGSISREKVFKMR